MVKAVFTVRINPSYKDRPDELYHFEGKRHLALVSPTVGEQIIYYESRRDAGENSRGGRSSYVAMARVASVTPDPEQDGYFYANIEDYIDFANPVPFKVGTSFFESALGKPDGRTDAREFRQSVRHISDDEFNAIVEAAFKGQEATPSLSASFDNQVDSNLDQPFNRPLVELTTLRPFRQRAFKRNVRAAYKNRCAITGLAILDFEGRPEVQAAHIKPVKDAGSDSVRNGLALSGTIHWLFDRGILAIDSDLTILRATKFLPPEIDTLIVPSGKLTLPSDPSQHPYLGYLDYHRDKYFLG